MNRITLFGIPALVGIAHAGLCYAIEVDAIATEGSWGWFLPFVLDFPVSILFLFFPKSVPPSIIFGVLGSLWWTGLSFYLLLLGRRASQKERLDQPRS